MRHTTTTILCVAVLCSALGGCSPRLGEYTTYRLSTSDTATVQNVVRANLKDPGSAQFGEMMATRDKTGIVRVCGLIKVSPKNSFGGYASNNQTYIGTLTSGVFTLRCEQNGMVLL